MMFLSKPCVKKGQPTVASKKPKQTQDNTKFYFSTEGETEEAYLLHLQKLINEGRKRKIKFITAVVKNNPLQKTANKWRSEVGQTPIDLYHFFDYEGSTKVDKERFTNIVNELQRIPKQEKSKNKIRCYHACYANLTFEMWIVLHKTERCANVNTKKDYIKLINKEFGETYETLDKFKDQDNFQKFLKKNITYESVEQAIANAEKIMTSHENDGIPTAPHCPKHPSTNNHLHIKTILETCGLAQTP